MTQYTLGHSAVKLNKLGFGLSPVTGFYGPVTDADKRVILDAVDMGIDFLDTNDSYSLGHAEQLLGDMLGHRKQDLRWVTKFGLIAQSNRQLPQVNGHPDYVQTACDASLARLRVDAIDLLYLHRVDPSVPIEETIGAMSRLVDSGKVKSIGLCEAHPDTIRRAHAVHPLSAVQTEYSLMYRDAAEATIAVTRELDISFVAYAPLGRGMLTGVFNSLDDVVDEKRKRHPRFAADNFDHNRRLVADLAEFAKDKNCTVSQLALAWLLHQGDDVVVIPGTTKTSHLVENLGALAVKLDNNELALLNKQFPAGAFKGQRFPQDQMIRMNL